MTDTRLWRADIAAVVAVAAVLAMPQTVLAASHDAGAGVEGMPAETEAEVEDVPADAEVEDAPVEVEEPPSGIVDAAHARASAGVQGLGAWIDRFFSDEDYEAEINESQLRLRFDGFVEEYEGYDGDARVRLYLKLPGLKERARVELQSAYEDLLPGGSDADGIAPSPSDEDNGDFAAALAYFFRNDEFRSISARAGVTFDGYNPDPYLGLRYRRLVPLNDDWNFRFIERVRFFSEDRFESYTSFDLERGFAEDRLFRANLGGTWLEEEEDFSYVAGFSLFDPIDEKSALEYQLFNAFGTKPHRLDEVTLRVRYRRQFWREWLTLEVAPQIAYPDARDFEPVPGILFRLEAVFGG